MRENYTINHVQTEQYHVARKVDVFLKRFAIKNQKSLPRTRCTLKVRETLSPEAQRKFSQWEQFIL